MKDMIMSKPGIAMSFVASLALVAVATAIAITPFGRKLLSSESQTHS